MGNSARGGKFEDAIILSIDPEFASQIYSSEKKYEFRKTPVPNNIKYVLLLESGKEELTGGFLVEDIYERDIDYLWENFAKDISEQERFYDYYSGWDMGVAIEVGSVEQFEEPILVEELTKMDSSLTIPQQFHFVYMTEKALREIETKSNLIEGVLPDSVSTTLRRFGTNPSEAQIDSLNFRPLQPGEEEYFRELFLDSPVPNTYDDISEEFIDQIIESHNKSEDPYGYFTKKKKVYTLLENKDIIGFTTTTWKRGNSVKYGPTMIKEEKQGEGKGPKLRKLIDSRLEYEGVRKSYSTIPDNAPNAYKYLIRSNYHIEAHMRKQYHDQHNELVFGKVLNSSSANLPPSPDREEISDLEFETSSSDFDDLHGFILEQAEPWYDEIDSDFVDAVIRAENRGIEADFSKKGKRIFIGHTSGKIRCLSIATLKRGGGVKISPVFSDVIGSGFKRYWESLEEDVMGIDGVRKLYTHIPILDSQLACFFRKNEYVPEGTLREPYKDGIDMIFYGKMVA